MINLVGWIIHNLVIFGNSLILCCESMSCDSISVGQELVCPATADLQGIFIPLNIREGLAGLNTPFNCNTKQQTTTVIMRHALSSAISCITLGNGHAKNLMVYIGSIVERNTNKKDP